DGEQRAQLLAALSLPVYFEHSRAHLSFEAVLRFICGEVAVHRRGRRGGERSAGEQRDHKAVHESSLSPSTQRRSRSIPKRSPPVDGCRTCKSSAKRAATGLSESSTTACRLPTPRPSTLHCPRRKTRHHRPWQAFPTATRPTRSAVAPMR